MQVVHRVGFHLASGWVLVAGCMAGGLLATCPVCGGEPAGTVDFYVATDGNDSWSGTLAAANADRSDGPFATLERARDEIRRRRATAAEAGKAWKVAVRGGTYELARSLVLESQDSGTDRAPITYRACPGEKVMLTGGKRLPAETFSKVGDESILRRWEPAARGQVVQVDLQPHGVSELGTFPVKYRGIPAVPELFFDHRRMTLAQWPNAGWATIAKIIAAGSNPREGERSGQGGVFEYSGDRPARWQVDAGVWLQGYWCFDWYAETIRIASIDVPQHRITLAAPSVYSVKQGNPSPRRYRARNVLEELDEPGEYYIDRQAGRLYFWPPGELVGARIELSTLKEPLLVLRDVEHVMVRGFTLECTQVDGMTVTGGRGVHIQACEVRNTRQLGIRVDGGIGHGVEGCDVHDTGTGGVVLAGGDRRRLIAAGHQAVNNHIWDFSRHQLTYANALLLEGVGNRAAHNLIHDAPHQAIGIGGNDHVFEYNVVYRICTETDDCGAYYKGRNPSCRGNIVRYNYWHDIGSPMGHGNAAVYFDDGDGGDTVFGNVFFRCGDPGKGSFGTVFSHGGHGLLAENNVFVQCKRALGSAPWNDKRWADYIRAPLWQTRLLQEVDIAKPPYTTRYPELIGFMEPVAGQPRTSQAVRNVFVQCGQVSNGNWQVDPAENWTTSGDPGFVDMAKDNFQLRADAEVFRKLPGFQPIPFDKMGLYIDALRPALPPGR